MVNACIGANGFLGKAIMNFARKFWAREEWIGITRENYNMWKGYTFGKIVWAAGSASKEICSDWNTAKQVNAHAVLDAITDFPHEKFIYISSQAIYPDDIVCPDETAVIDETKLSNYGRSKRMGESIVKRYASKHCIVRPNGFSGPNLKKNAIFYMAQPEPLLYYDWDSYAQYMHVDTFADILLLLAYYYENETFNLTSPDTINMRGIATLLGVKEGQVKPFRDPLPLVKAEINVSKMMGALKERKYDSRLLAAINSNRAVLYWNQSLYRYEREKGLGGQ
jgi:nucleoside-diphosphate-sugar epimerase